MNSFATPGAVLVTVECPAGEVLLTTHDHPRTDVDVVALRNDDATRHAVERTTVELRQRGNGHEVVIEVPRRVGSFFGREARLRVEVSAPHGTSLSFTTASADVSSRGRLGDVRGKTASGDVNVPVAESIHVDTASGDLRIGDVAGEAELRSASGDIKVGTVGGTLNASVVSGDLRVAAAPVGGAAAAVSGDIELGAVTEGELSIRTVSGDVTVGVTKGSRVHVDVTTVTGDLKSDLDLEDAEPGGEGPYLDVRGKTVSGDLRLKRTAG